MFLGVFMKLSEMPNQETSSTQENVFNQSKTFDTQKKKLNDTYNELKDCSADELMTRLAKEVQSQKTSGTFDYDALVNSIEKIKIYLPAQTYQNMLRIIENLK